MKITLMNGDALIELKKIPDETVDCIITDPPYNISTEGGNISRKYLKSKTHKRQADIKLDFGEWDKKTEDEYYQFTQSWISECARILKPKGWIYIFFSKERLGYLLDPRNGLFKANGIFSKTVITWHKSNPTPSFRKMNYVSSTEFIAVGSKGPSKIPHFLEQTKMHNFFETSNASIYGETEHPTEKPTALIGWLIDVSAAEVILDPFIGSGTTGVSAVRHGLDFIGIELDEKYFAIAKERIEKEALQSRLYGEEEMELVNRWKS